MRKKALLLVLCAAALLLGLVIYGQSPQLPSMVRFRFPKDNPKEAMFLILFGGETANPQSWNGEINVTKGELEAIRGYKFEVEDKILLPNRWSVAGRTGARRRNTQRDVFRSEPDVGVMVTLVAEEGCEVAVHTTRGNFRFQPAEIDGGGRKTELEGDAQVVRVPVARDIGSTWWEDDYPSLAADRDGTVWVAWTGYHDGRDEVGMRAYKDGEWSNYLPVPGNHGDVWWPQVVVDEKDDPWVIFAQQDKGNWDLYAAGYHVQENSWSDVERITDHKLPDSNHQVAIDAAGNLHVVWQGFRGTNSDIFLRVRRGGVWSDTYTVTAAAGNDWEPSIALDSSGRAWIAWDTYRKGNYDVHLLSFKDGQFGEEMAVAETPYFEARASVVVDQQDRVWIAWEEGDVNWGKDVGFTNPAKYKGTVLGGRRELRVGVLANGRLHEPAGQPDEAAVTGSASFQPRLLLDGNGNVGILFNRRIQHFGNNRQSLWEQQLTFYRGKSWTTPIPLPLSWSRPSTRGSVVAAPNGELWSAYATDNRVYAMPHRPLRNQIYAARMPSLAAASAELIDRVPETASAGGTHPDERGDLKAIRGYRTSVDGSELQIVRGDTHRHTALSWDGGGTTDGSLLEFYRYALDAASLDWANVSDHQGGGTYYDYYWWFNNKMTDMYYVPGAYTALFGYERGMLYPDGHRNVVSASRALRVLPFLRKLNFGRERQPAEIPPGGGNHAVNDVKYLYKYLHRNGAIAISHTSGTNMGTDWRDNDPAIEPVVEIFQGCRTNYEQIGAPLSAKSSAAADAPGGYHPDGYVNNAWAKGYRLGVIASSDHNSTHMSYALVYTADRSRQGIIDAIKRRHTYGATDNIILDYRMGTRFMGDDFESDKALPIRTYARGTKKIAAVRVIRDQQIIHAATPMVQETTVNFLDNAISPGQHYYYVRVEQEDGQVAWSSPIWVKYR